MAAAIADAVNRAVMVAIWIERVLTAAMVDDVMGEVAAACLAGGRAKTLNVTEDTSKVSATNGQTV